jgi:hypothetical protein
MLDLYRKVHKKESRGIYLPGLDEKYVVEFLKNAVDWLATRLPKFIKSTDTDLLNIRDELIAAINQALYLFTLR